MVGLVLLLNLIAQDSPEDINHFMKGVWSPYCKGISLLECPSGNAERLRDEIRAEFQDGRSIEEIRESLRTKYGDQIRMEPQSTWRGNLAYLIPWVVFTIVIVFVAIFWKKRASRSSSSNEPTRSAIESSSQEKEVLDEIEARLR